MKHQTFNEIEALLSTAQSTAAEMMTGAAQNSAARRVDLPMCTFVDIAGMLRTLSEEVGRMRQEDHAALPGRATGALTREAWTELLGAVPTMGNDSLADVLAPAEIAEIAAAVMAALPAAQDAPASERPVALAPSAPATTDVIDDRFLERLFATYACQVA